MLFVYILQPLIHVVNLKYLSEKEMTTMFVAAKVMYSPQHYIVMNHIFFSMVLSYYKA